MKNIKHNFLKIAICAFVAVFLVSCNDDGYDEYGQDNTPTQALNGEWYIDIIDEASGSVLVENILHKTYDTGANDGKMFIDDEQAGYYIKGRVNTNTSDLTFSVTDEGNLNDALDEEGNPLTTFTITEGKILKNAGFSTDRNVVDSIFFKGEFSYDPGTIIIFAGRKRTGFEEDEH